MNCHLLLDRATSFLGKRLLTFFQISSRFLYGFFLKSFGFLPRKKCDEEFVCERKKVKCDTFSGLEPPPHLLSSDLLDVRSVWLMLPTKTGDTKQRRFLNLSPKVVAVSTFGFCSFLRLPANTKHQRC